MSQSALGAGGDSSTSDLGLRAHQHSDDESALRIGMREGQGRFIAKDRSNMRNYEYQGEWTDNKRDGFGRCYFYNGDLYEGDWVRGKRHGKGKAFLQSGERYVGMWEADRRHGQGTLWRADGTMYIGSFLHDQKHGQGKLCFPDGSLHIEDWQNGHLKNRQRIANPNDSD